MKKLAGARWLQVDLGDGADAVEALIEAGAFVAHGPLVAVGGLPPGIDGLGVVGGYVEGHGMTLGGGGFWATAVVGPYAQVRGLRAFL